MRGAGNGPHRSIGPAAPRHDRAPDARCRGSFAKPTPARATHGNARPPYVFPAARGLLRERLQGGNMYYGYGLGGLLVLILIVLLLTGRL